VIQHIFVTQGPVSKSVLSAMW